MAVTSIAKPGTDTDPAHIALRAAWEIADLLDELIAQGASLSAGERRPAVIRALALRSRKLTSAVIAALDEGSIEVAASVMSEGLRKAANG
jgi:hypothetical protein